MKIMPATDRGVAVPTGQRLISTTDLKGRITYANDIFCRVSGFSRQEMLGRPHNIVRHPDMPPAAFANLWQRLKADQSWHGMVKNRCKNGDHYWVDAYITPIYQNGSKIGYQSVRTRPTEEQIQTAEKLYAGIRNDKKTITKALKLRGFSRQWMLMIITVVALIALQLALNTSWPALVVSVLALLPAMALYLRLTQRIEALAERYQERANNPLEQRVFAQDMTPLGTLELALITDEARIRTVLGSLDDLADTISHQADALSDTMNNTHRQISTQNNEVDQISASMTELAASAQEIAGNGEGSSNASQQAHENASHGEQSLTEMISAIEHLDQRMESTLSSSQQLVQRAEEIGEIVTVISGITEQTNLLALNAAIEAARAGQQGRGFAVVADEVRTLATRTHGSTEQIQQFVEHIQHAVNETAEQIGIEREETQHIVQTARDTAERFKALRLVLSDVSNRTIQIAGTTEEQSSVVADIQQTMERINQQSQEIESLATETETSTTHLVTCALDLRSMVQAFDRQSAA